MGQCRRIFAGETRCMREVGRVGERPLALGPELELELELGLELGLAW